MGVETGSADGTQDDFELSPIDMAWDPAVDGGPSADDLSREVRALLQAERKHSFRGEVIQITAAPTTDGRDWELKLNMPSSSEEKTDVLPHLKASLLRAIAHEEAKYPTESVEWATISLRSQTSRYLTDVDETVRHNAHFDGPKLQEEAAVFYVFASAIPSVQVTGSITSEQQHSIRNEELEVTPEGMLAGNEFPRIAVSSLLSGRFYRIDYSNLHAMPYAESWERYFQHSDENRVFVRLCLLK